MRYIRGATAPLLIFSQNYSNVLENLRIGAIALSKQNKA